MFDGWAPTEIHEHFDADGVKIGHTEVTHEPLWSDDDRERALGLDAYEASLCPCGCGLPTAESHDKRRAFSVEKATCYARRALDGVRRDAQKKAEASGTDPSRFDGLFWYIDRTFIDE